VPSSLFYGLLMWITLTSSVLKAGLSGFLGLRVYGNSRLPETPPNCFWNASSSDRKVHWNAAHPSPPQASAPPRYT